ncbi:MAG: uroporphyrinogen decarboxylase family protein, partial [Clostridiales bacterium]|nr:uroporphyrinogen decarboxylase family protein [Clostridiales bacterium]
SWKKPVFTYKDGSYVDDYGVLLRPSEYYYDPVKRSLAGPITLEDIKNCKCPDPNAPGLTDGLREEVKKMHENTHFSILGDFVCGGPFEQSIWIRGFEDFLGDLYTEPMLAEALMDKVTENGIEMWDVFLTAVGDYVDVVCQGDDLGMQDRAFIPSYIYDRHIKKYHKRMYDFIKTKTRAKILHHSCGSVYELIPGLIEAGVDILNPIQTSAKNMEPERLKEEFGKDLTFWGGLDVQKVLPFGTLQEIEDEVKKVINIMSKDGGYVFAPGHNIQPLVPPQNVAAMMDAVMKYRKY